MGTPQSAAGAAPSLSRRVSDSGASSHAGASVTASPTGMSTPTAAAPTAGLRGSSLPPVPAGIQPEDVKRLLKGLRAALRGRIPSFSAVAGILRRLRREEAAIEAVIAGVYDWKLVDNSESEADLLVPEGLQQEAIEYLMAMVCELAGPAAVA